MRTESDIELAVTLQEAWAFLWDLDRVIHCLPGARDVRTVVEHAQYTAVVSQRVGPFSVEFPLDVRVLEVDAPHHLKAEAQGRDRQSGTSLRVVFDLRLRTAASTTHLVVESDTEVRGAMAGFAEGLLREKAGGAMAQFADSVRRAMEAG